MPDVPRIPTPVTLDDGPPNASSSPPLPDFPPPSMLLPPPVKSDAAKSESWVSLLAILGSLANGFVNSHSHVVSLISLLTATGVYAYCRSPLASDRPGWKTPAFAAAVISIVGSVATSLLDANLPFLPAGVTKDVTIIASGAAAGGYTIYRYQVKKKGVGG